MLYHNHIAFPNRLLSLAAFILCIKCILASSHPVWLAMPAVATLIMVIWGRGNGALLFLIIAFGPILNLTAFLHDPAVYNVEVILFAFFGGWFWKNDLIIGDKRDGVLISYGIMLGAVLAASFVQVIFQHRNIPGELRLIRAFLLGGFLLLFLKNYYEERWFIYYKSVIAAALVIDVWGIIELLRSGPAGSFSLPLPHSVFGNSEMLAVYLCAVIPMLHVGRAELTRKRWARGALGATFASFLLLLATRSRAGLIAITIIGLYWFFGIARQKKDRGYAEATVIVLAALCAAGMIGLKTFTSAPASIHAALGMLFSSRLGVWVAADAWFRTNPLWGTGPLMNVYNLYLQLLCQFGIIGLAAFLILLRCLFNRYKIMSSREMKGLMAKGAFLSVMAFLIVSMGESTMGNQFAYYAWFLFFFAAEPEIGTSGPLSSKGEETGGVAQDSTL